VTDTKPAPSLADVIRRCTDVRGYWLSPKNVDQVIAAVATHLASPEVIERMAYSAHVHMSADSVSVGLPRWEEIGDSQRNVWRTVVRAAVAAVVGENGNG
jgi:hypothetical protein